MSAAADTSRIIVVRQSAATRRRMVSLGLALALLAAFAMALYLGDYPVPISGIVQSLLSPLTGLADRSVDFIVLQVRLPRAILAVLSGASFALAGIIFQTLLRNPLASPDIIGIAHGASAAAVFCIIILGWSGLAVSFGAFGGAVLTALAIYFLAWRNGVTAFRVVLIGIGMAATVEEWLPSSPIFSPARASTRYSRPWPGSWAASMPPARAIQSFLSAPCSCSSR